MSTVPANNDFRINLRAAMESRGYSQRAFAAKFGTGCSYINRVLCGRVQPTMDQAEALANAAGFRLADLLVSPKNFQESLLTTVD